MMATSGRIRRLTAEAVNTRLKTRAEARVAYHARHPEEIGDRLRELDEEWDIERAIEMEAAGTILTGLFLGMTVSRKWLLLPVLASGLMLLHNLHGGYPLLPLFRRLGFRTANEIARERYALKAIRGDFLNLGTDGREKTHEAFIAARGNGNDT
jgi:hypothetical protein